MAQFILNKINSNLSEEFLLFHKILKESIKSNVKYMNIIMNYILKKQGKQMRPMFVFLCAGLFGKVPEKALRGAVLIELLHIATLVHDDVVDESYYRRGFLSINAIWKNKVSVLSGDYLLSRGLILAISNKDFDLLEIVSSVVKEMSEGELLQLENGKKHGLDEDIYFEIIKQKTASLISACCSIGAYSNGAEEHQIELIKKFGFNVGIAFQLRDDLLDFSTTFTGKPKIHDLHSKNFSLPIIFSLKQAENSIKEKIIKILKMKKPSANEISTVIKFVQDMGGLDYTKQKINDLLIEANKQLDDLPNTEYSKMLKDLVQFTAEREK